MKQRILHTIETRGPGGAEILILSIAKELEDRGYQGYGFFIKSGWLSDRFSENGFISKIVPILSKYDIIFFLKFLKFIRENNIDVIHSHEFAMSFYSTLAGLLLNKKVVCTFHGHNYHSSNLLRIMIMKFIDRYSSLVTVSDELRGFLEDNSGLRNLSVVQNGIRKPQFSKNVNYRSVVGVEKESVLVGLVGRLHPVKGIEYFIKAADLVCREYDNVHFVIAGEGRDEVQLKCFVSQLELDDRIHFLGAIEDIGNFYNSIDLFVMSSLEEGKPLALLEAMSFGLNIVATSVGSIPEVVDKNCGILVPPRNEKALSQAIITMVDSGKYKEINHCCVERVDKLYSQVRMIDSYVGIYENRLA